MVNKQYNNYTTTRFRCIGLNLLQLLFNVPFVSFDFICVSITRFPSIESNMEFEIILTYQICNEQKFNDVWKNEFAQHSLM